MVSRWPSSVSGLAPSSFSARRLVRPCGPAMPRHELGCPPFWLPLPSDAEQMRANAEQGGLALQRPRDLQQIGSAAWIAHPLGDVREQPSRAFDGIDPRIPESRGTELCDGVAWLVEIRRREIVESFCRVAVLPLGEVTLHNRREARVLKQVPRKTIKGRCPAGYSDHQHT